MTNQIKTALFFYEYQHEYQYVMPPEQVVDDQQAASGEAVGHDPRRWHGYRAHRRVRHVLHEGPLEPQAHARLHRPPRSWRCVLCFHVSLPARGVL